MKIAILLMQDDNHEVNRKYNIDWWNSNGTIWNGAIDIETFEDAAKSAEMDEFVASQNKT